MRIDWANLQRRIHGIYSLTCNRVMYPAALLKVLRGRRPLAHVVSLKRQGNAGSGRGWDTEREGKHPEFLRVEKVFLCSYIYLLTCQSDYTVRELRKMNDDC